jgi:hypothetical protein
MKTISCLAIACLVGFPNFKTNTYLKPVKSGGYLLHKNQTWYLDLRYCNLASDFLPQLLVSWFVYNTLKLTSSLVVA